jgi:hypothetical protein
VLDGTDEIFAPTARSFRSLAVDPVEMRLQIAVGAGDVSDFDAEKDVAAVSWPSADVSSTALVVG